VGVAADVRQEYGDPNVADLYAPITPASVGRFGSFYVRSDRPLASIVGDARAVAAGLDPRAVVDLPKTVASENRRLAGTTFLTTMLTGFAAIAGFLAVLGIYGVTAYGVQQRQREIAIRLALGAPGGRVVRLFLKEGAAVLAAGLAAGLAGVAAAVRILEHQLFAVGPFDPATLASTCVLLAAAGVSAIWWPARTASRANPILSLKEG
jgi:ABC-type antimicrobial peptide transport system permease subunit